MLKMFSKISFNFIVERLDKTIRNASLECMSFLFHQIHTLLLLVNPS